MILVAGYASVDQRLLAWHRYGNVHRDAQPFIYRHSVCTCGRV